MVNSSHKMNLWQYLLISLRRSTPPPSRQLDISASRQRRSGRAADQTKLLPGSLTLSISLTPSISLPWGRYTVARYHYRVLSLTLSLSLSLSRSLSPHPSLSLREKRISRCLDLSSHLDIGTQTAEERAGGRPDQALTWLLSYALVRTHPPPSN